MKVTTPEISWHERDPIYSVDIQPGNRRIKRLVSGGVDKFVRVKLCYNIVYDHSNNKNTYVRSNNVIELLNFNKIFTNNLIITISILL